MKELVDLYAKLVIGTFTFLGPSFTLLISLFSKQVLRASQKNKDRLQTLINLDGHNTLLKQQIESNERQLNLLNPKRQMLRLFGALMFCIVTIGFYHFQSTRFWSMSSPYVKFFTIVISLLSFLYCLFSLWQVFCIIITSKMEDEEEFRKTNTLLTPKNLVV